MLKISDRVAAGEVRAFAFASTLFFTTTTALTLWPTVASARDPICAAGVAVDLASPVAAPATVTLGEAVAAGDALEAEADRPRARALYLAVLARDPLDDDAEVGLARVDAADGCVALAELSYRAVLARTPGHVAARVGLADLLLHERRWDEAERTLTEGLAVEPFAPELLARRARVAYFRGDAPAAVFWSTEAEAAAPLDAEIRDLRDRAFVGQARLGQRVQWFPSSYDDLVTTDASAVQRWRRLRFEGAMTFAARSGATRATRSGENRTPIIDGRPSFGAYLHFGAGAWAGASIATAAPATALPVWAYSVSGFTPVWSTPLSIQLTGAFWRYRDDRDVAILSPALGIAVTERLDVTLKYWLTTVFHDGTSESAHSAGVRIGWRPIARTTFGLDYTYGVQLERNPTALELTSLRSHIVSLLAMRQITRSFGVDAALGLERRAGPNAADVWGPSAEVGVFARW